MTSACDIRRAIRDWLVRNGKLTGPSEIDDTTPILDQRIISSVQVIDLLVFLEKLAAKDIDIEKLRPGSFRSVNAIYQTFFQREHP